MTEGAIVPRLLYIEDNDDNLTLGLLTQTSIAHVKADWGRSGRDRLLLRGSFLPRARPQSAAARGSCTFSPSMRHRALRRARRPCASGVPPRGRITKLS
jgi:hypothetical protein